WSMPILVRELFSLYDGTPLPPARPYRDFLSWLGRRDTAAAVAAWRAALSDVDEPALLAPPGTGHAQILPEQVRAELPAELGRRLAARARELGVPVNTAVQAAWAIVLGRVTGRDDVLFGQTVAGRPADLAGAEAMIGLFINTIPVRVRTGPGGADAVPARLPARPVRPRVGAAPAGRAGARAHRDRRRPRPARGRARRVRRARGGTRLRRRDEPGAGVRGSARPHSGRDRRDL